MEIRRALATAAAFAAVFCVAEASKVTNIKGQIPTERAHKMDQMVNDMYMTLQIMKTLMSMLLMFVSPIIQIKGFGLSVINTLINIARFLVMMQNTKKFNDHVHQLNRIHEHDRHSPSWNRDDHNSFLVVKDKHPLSSNHDDHSWKVHQDDNFHGSEGSWIDNGNQNNPSWSENHDSLAHSWAMGRIDTVWNSSLQSQNQHDLSSQQLSDHYAQQPNGSAERRQQYLPEVLPPVHPSYVSGGNFQNSIHPFFSPNLTRFR